MRSFSAAINIKMRQGVIWEILVDAPRYPEWDPGTSRIEGVIGLGQELRIYSHANADEPQVVTVTDLTPGVKMVWTGGANKLMFKTTRSFFLKKMPDSSIDFMLKEEYSGLAAPVMVNKMSDPSQSFQDFLVGLKTRALQKAGRPMS